MKKKILCLVMTLLMTVGTTVTASAADHQSTGNWVANFNGSRIESNFSNNSVADVASNVLPGDSIELEIQLRNSSTSETDWYMSNQVLTALEDGHSSASGAAYEYRLSYVDSTGAEDVIFDSSTVGGDDRASSANGLKQATEALGDADTFFFVDRLANNQAGSVRLRIEIEGETSTNAYQNTLAQLQMQFAVELVAVGEERTTTEYGANTTVRRTVTGSATTRMVRTGDDNNILLYSGLALASAIILMFLGFYFRKERKSKKTNNTLMMLLLAGVLIGASTSNVQAAAPYTYTVTLYAGDKGTVGGGDSVVRDDLNYGDTINFESLSIQATDSKYYVKGVRLSGQDTIFTNLSFPVNGDADYVVAYGIRANQVAYTINYVDDQGNVLYPSETRYGDVGDRPVVSYQYIEGYVPQALALTGTLSANAADNVWNFIYTSSAATDTVTTVVVPGTTTVVTVTEPGPVTTVTVPGDTTTPDATTPATPVTDADAAAAADGNQAAIDAADGAAGDDTAAADDGTVASPDEDTPQGLVDLDDEEVPTSDVDLDGSTTASSPRNIMPIVIGGGIGVAALAALGALVFQMRKRL